MRTMKRRYLCDDGNAEVEIVAATPRAAAQEYVDGGEWGEITETSWIHVYVQLASGRGPRHCITIELQPEQPECSDGGEHEWQAPYEIVGGIEENPGVWGHGGGVIIHEVCILCGCQRTTDTWAQDRETGAQGLRSVEYHEHYYDIPAGVPS